MRSGDCWCSLLLIAMQEIRRKSTKETQDIKEDLKKKEQLKEAAAKRKEKQDEIEAKARIKAKIAADKEERQLEQHRKRQSARVEQFQPQREVALRLRRWALWNRSPPRPILKLDFDCRPVQVICRRHSQ